MARTSVWSRIWAIVRLLAALGIAAAVLAQAIASFSEAAANGRHVVTVVSNFFSFFTILSNVLAVIALLWAASWFWVRGPRRSVEPAPLAFALAAATTYMIVTGIVYNLLLRGYPLEQTIVGWSNEVLHLIGPAFLLLDLFVGPRRRRLPWTALVGILVFPLVWVLYTLVRAGLITNPTTGDPWWYPYPFLNPHINTYPMLMLYVGAIAAGIVAVAAGVVGVGRLRGRRRDAGAAAPASTAVVLPSVAAAAGVTDPVLPAPLPLPAAGPVEPDPPVATDAGETLTPVVVEYAVVEDGPEGVALVVGEIIDDDGEPSHT